MAADLAGLVSRLEAVTTRLEGVTVGGGGGGSGGSRGVSPAAAEALAPSVLSYDAQINPLFDNFLSLSAKIGGLVNTQAELVKKAFGAQRDILIKASKCKQPEQQALMDVLTPLSQQIAAVQELKDGNRGDPLFNHLSAIGEAIPALGWVSVAPTPAPYVKEMLDAGTFYTNRVLKEHKDKNQTHVDWVRAWTKTLTELQVFVKQEHTTGLAWNAQGVDVSSVSSPKAAAAPPPPPPGGAPPPPPPPGPPPPPELMAAAPAAGGGEDSDASRGALFADINKGTDVTKGLKKVTDDMKTHKNPTIRQGPQPYKPSPNVSPKPFKPFNAAAKPQQAKPVAVQKPPKLELEGKKWIVEHHVGNRQIVLDQTNMKQAVYVFKCQDCTIQVKGKVNSIILDNCKKTALVFDDVISSVDFVNCQSVQAQATGKVPTISIDKTDGCMVYLSKESVASEIVSAKSSEMNILVPDETGEFKEFAVPEQFKTKYDGKKLVTGPSDIAV